MSRVDLDVYNEASGFMITSEGLAGGDYSTVEDGDSAWMDAVREGIFLPFRLYQDDPFVIRVVVDEVLTDHEQEEWVGKLVTKLRVPDGRLAVLAGGQEYLWGEDMEEFSHFLDIPAGDYQAEVYTYLNGVNGESCLEAAGEPEPLGAYFRRTRPGQEFPLWLHNICANYPSNDPEHVAEWRSKQGDYETEQPRMVSFLLRLTPLQASPELPRIDHGWIEIVHGPRRPTIFPLGIVADRLAPRQKNGH